MISTRNAAQIRLGVMWGKRIASSFEVYPPSVVAHFWSEALESLRFRPLCQRAFIRTLHRRLGIEECEAWQ